MQIDVVVCEPLAAKAAQAPDMRSTVYSGKQSNTLLPLLQTGRADGGAECLYSMTPVTALFGSRYPVTGWQRFRPSGLQNVAFTQLLSHPANLHPHLDAEQVAPYHPTRQLCLSDDKSTHLDRSTRGWSAAEQFLLALFLHAVRPRAHPCTNNSDMSE